MVLSDDRRGDRGRRPAKREVFLYDFDLLELNGRDIRREPWSDRRWKLARLLRGAGHGVQLSDHMLFPVRPHVEQTATKIKHTVASSEWALQQSRQTRQTGTFGARSTF